MSKPYELHNKYILIWQSFLVVLYIFFAALQYVDTNMQLAICNSPLSLATMHSNPREISHHSTFTLRQV